MNRELKIVGAGLALTLALAVLPTMAGEGRIQFWEPIQINPGDEGSYILTRDITAAGTAVPAIDIQPGVGAVDIDLNGFTVDGAIRGAISAQQVDSLTVRNGTVTGGSGIRATECRDVVIEDVRVVNTNSGGIWVTEATNVALRRNVLDEVGQYDAGIFVTGIEPDGPGMRVFIEDNVVRVAETWSYDGIGVVYGSGVVIKNNLVEGPFNLKGIQVVDSGGTIIAGNIVQNTLGDGIGLELSPGCKLLNNVVTGSAANGISIGPNCPNSLLLDNVATANALVGLYVGPGRNHIERNVLNDNGTWGLYLAGSANTYRGNTAQGNTGGTCPGSPATTDFCDAGTDNVSPFNQGGLAGDNLMPGLL